MRKFLTFILLAAVFGMGCADNTDNTPDGFDRKAMLENVANHIILPNLADLDTKVETLKTSADAFIANPSETTLETLQDQWQEAFISWQYCASFNFGPGAEKGIHKALWEEVATFPASSAKIENYITLADNSQNNFDRDSRGFSGIEYLIFRLDGNNTQIIQDYVTSEARRLYLQSVIQHLQQKIHTVKEAWGDYKTSFINNTGTDVGSSTSDLYNQFLFDYELLKNFKLGLPLGKRPGQVSTEPELVEGYYSGISRILISHQLTAIYNLWEGRAKDGTDGTGFEEYVQSVTGGAAIVEATKTQWQTILETFATIPQTPSLSDQIVNNITPVEHFHTELSKHTKNFKSDMSSVIGIYITYSSGDGD